MQETIIKALELGQKCRVRVDGGLWLEVVQYIASAKSFICRDDSPGAVCGKEINIESHRIHGVNVCTGVAKSAQTNTGGEINGPGTL